MQKGKGIQTIVLVPTRELCVQVTESLKQFSKYQPFRIAAIYGGVSINPQMDQLRYSEVVVGTPGRVLDHLSQGTMKLDKINMVVLDEADRMLDMGFINDVKKILHMCPVKSAPTTPTTWTSRPSCAGARQFVRTRACRSPWSLTACSGRAGRTARHGGTVSPQTVSTTLPAGPSGAAWRARVCFGTPAPRPAPPGWAFCALSPALQPPRRPCRRSTAHGTAEAGCSLCLKPPQPEFGPQRAARTLLVAGAGCRGPTLLQS